MSPKLEKFIVLIGTLIVCIGIIAWSFFFNFGKIEIESNQPFQVEGIGKTPLVCQTGKCLYKVPTGVFEAIFHADQYQDILTPIEIRRFQTTSAELNFKFAPQLITLSNNSTPNPILELPDFLQNNPFYRWNQAKTQIAFLEEDATRLILFIWDIKNEQKNKITFFYNLTNPEFFWGTKKMILREKEEVFLVDLITKLKYKIQIKFDTNLILFNSLDDKFLYQHQGKLWLFDLKNQNSSPLNLNPFPREIIWKDLQTLVYIAEENKKSHFFEYDLTTKTQNLIFTTNLKKPEKLQISENQKSLVFENDKTQYELKLIQ